MYNRIIIDEEINAIHDFGFQKYMIYIVFIATTYIKTN